MHLVAVLISLSRTRLHVWGAFGWLMVTVSECCFWGFVKPFSAALCVWTELQCVWGANPVLSLCLPLLFICLERALGVQSTDASPHFLALIKQDELDHGTHLCRGAIPLMWGILKLEWWFELHFIVGILCWALCLFTKYNWQWKCVFRYKYVSQNQMT